MLVHTFTPGMFGEGKATDDAQRKKVLSDVQDAFKEAATPDAVVKKMAEIGFDLSQLSPAKLEAVLADAKRGKKVLDFAMLRQHVESEVVREIATNPPPPAGSVKPKETSKAAAAGSSGGGGAKVVTAGGGGAQAAGGAEMAKAEASSCCVVS